MTDLDEFSSFSGDVEDECKEVSFIQESERVEQQAGEKQKPAWKVYFGF